MEPTARALILGPLLADALAVIRGAVQIGRQFDPGTAARRFAVAAPDTVVATLAQAVLAELAQAAASLFPVSLHEPPMAIPGFKLTLLRHRDGLADPAITWLAELVTKAFLSEAADGHH